MHDIRKVRENPEAFDAGLARRGLDPLSAALLDLDKARRELETRAQDIQTERNAAAKEIGQRKAKGEDAQDLIDKVSQSKVAQAEAEAEAKAKTEELEYQLMRIPNLPDDDVPFGTDEKDNKPKGDPWGTPKRSEDFGFKVKDHVDLGEGLGMMDFETAAKMSGARFVVLSGKLARLERALANFMLDQQTEENGFTEVNPPALVKDTALFGTGQLPKFAEDLFKTEASGYSMTKLLDLFLREINRKIGEIGKALLSAKKPKTELLQQKRAANSLVMVLRDIRSSDSTIDLIQNDPNPLFALRASLRDLVQKQDDSTWDDVERLYEDLLADAQKAGKAGSNMWLIPTAEVPLTNIVSGEMLAEDTLPRRYTAMTWCFRSEAGSAGKDTRGMIRQHQFTKVEMVCVTKPEDSDAELERMTRCAEGILEKLDLPYRTITLCTGDMGFGAAKTYDIEVWLPAQDTYREISSCSNTRDFQARRMNARFKRSGEKKPEFVNTLNGSGLAVGRTLVAVLENYQNEDGSITVPEALRPYMGGLEVISKDA